VLYLSPYHRPVQNSAKFHKKGEIPQKLANSAALLKIPCSSENCGATMLYMLLTSVLHIDSEQSALVLKTVIFCPTVLDLLSVFAFELNVHRHYRTSFSTNTVNFSKAYRMAR